MQADEALLDEIDRIHDAEPERAVRLLREFDAGALPATRLGELAFLYNHLLGEKLGRWDEAAERIAQLAVRDDAPPGVWRQLFAAHTLRGDALGAAAARTALAKCTGASDAEANWAGELTVLAYVADPLARAEDVLALAKAAAQIEASPLDAALAACFNNVTARLLEASLNRPLGAAEAAALRAGAEAARRFWYRAGRWLQHERADYLCAKVDVRVGDAAAAIAAAEHGLRLVEANGNDAIERAFLLLPLAAALAAGGNAERAQAVRAEAHALARGFDPATRAAFEQDAAELFGPRA
jgi:hypothetical protein